MKFLRWQDDSFWSENGHILTWDKLEHFIREFLLILLNVFIIKINMLNWVIVVELFGIAWEMKDGLFPYGNERSNPGRLIEGFSFKDLIANQAGIITGLLILWL